MFTFTISNRKRKFVDSLLCYLKRTLLNNRLDTT